MFGGTAINILNRENGEKSLKEFGFDVEDAEVVVPGYYFTAAQDV
jgi:hypothetical protein